MHQTGLYGDPKMRAHGVLKRNAVRVLDRLGIGTIRFISMSLRKYAMSS